MNSHSAAPLSGRSAADPAAPCAVPHNVSRLAERLARQASAVVVLAVAGLFVLAGCDQKRIEQLEEGVATEADVRAQFGQPYAIVEDGQGGKTLEYPRQPEGLTNYMITIGPDGKMSALRQLLNPDNLKRVAAGQSRDDVRRSLGKPAKMIRYALKQQEVWDWRFQAPGQDPMVFSVTFDDGGRVVGTATLPDTKNVAP
jgi:outer membrane protein assembly factor BamE (lipoprotein component of BamABCDE complex)